MTDEIETHDLIISKQLRMDLNKYRTIFPHIAAAIQLSNTGKQPTKGDTIKYIYTNVEHQNPMNRVITAKDWDNNSGLEYDKENYKDMLLDAAETT
jgi:DNA polymerase elongation subunit (family B)